MKLPTKLMNGLEILSEDERQILTALVNKMASAKKEAAAKEAPLLKELKDGSKENIFPIPNSILSQETDFIKNSYFRCLAIALTQCGDATENQLCLYDRLAAGVGMEGYAQSCIRKSYDIQLEQVLEFARLIEGGQLKYRFMTDFMVLAGCGVPDQRFYSLITDFAGILHIGVDEVKYLTEKTKSILAQDAEAYWQLSMENTTGISDAVTEEYMVKDDLALEGLFKKASELFRLYNPQKALPLLKELSNAGHGESNALLYWLYRDGYYENGHFFSDEDLGRKCLQKGYEAGDVVSTMLYAFFFREERDEELAKRTLPALQKLADQGDIYAEYMLGIVDINHYLNGEPDYYSAVLHFMRANHNGFYRAVGSIFFRHYLENAPFENDWVHASLWAEKLIQYNSFGYMTFEIACMYMQIEKYGCEEEKIQNRFYKKAIELWKTLVDLGDVVAGTNLGWMYSNGCGTDVDMNMAVKFYKISAERGSAVGQCNLAGCYEDGRGIETNRNKAIVWYRKSAAQGNEKAKKALERLGESLY